MAQAQLHVEVVSPEGLVFQGEADEVLLPTEKGEIGVLPHHIPLFTKLIGGEVRIKQGSKDTSFAISGGFLEVNPASLVILADFAVKAESIEVSRAEEAKRKAEQLIKERNENVDFELAEKELERAILQLHVADKVKKRRVS